MIYTFDRFEDFQEKALELGITSDLEKLRSLDILFYEQYPSYLLFSLVSFESGVNKITILTKDNALIYPSMLLESNRFMKIAVKGPYGESTMAAYTVLKKVSEIYQNYFEAINREIAKVSETPSSEKLTQLTRRLRRLQDIADDFMALLMRLKEREVPFVDTHKIGYDFDILIARTRHLSHRCSSATRELARLYTLTEMRATTDLNRRIENLTEIMKRLTSITVILMLPTMLASHYGMNFRDMPELSTPGAYQLVTLMSLSFMLFAYLYFRHKHWL